MAFSFLQIISFSTIDLSASIFVELETRAAFISDALIVDHLEMFRALSEFAAAFWSKDVSLFASSVAGSLK